MLLRAAYPDLALALVVPAAEQHPHVGEQCHQGDLALQDVGVGTEREADIDLVVDRGARIGRIDVVAEHEVAECEQVGVAAFGRCACAADDRVGQLERGRRTSSESVGVLASSRTRTAPAGTCTLAADEHLAHSTGGLRR